MDDVRIKYFKAILPLRLEWEPCYGIGFDVPLEVGDRVGVTLAGKRYVAVVSGTDVTPDIDPDRVQMAEGRVESLERISQEELRLWRFISEYYLCSVGEVYKAAYPSGRQMVESRKSRKTLPQPGQLRIHPLSQTRKDAVRAILEGFDADSNVVLKARGRVPVYCELARRVLEGGRSVLVLSPTVGGVGLLLKELETWFPGMVMGCCGSDSAASRRELAHLLRKGEPRIVVGTRQSIFLPFTRLGLVIVDEEQDPGFKQDSPSPRYNARDAATVLGSIHGAMVLLGSGCLSLETLQNVRAGKFLPVTMEEDSLASPLIIDTSAELRKNGMDGSFSKILSIRAGEVLKSKGKVLLVVPWKDTADLEIEWRERFPAMKVRFASLSTVRGKDLRGYGLVGLLASDYIAPNTDFRADEKGRRAIGSLLSSCADGALYVQTRNAAGAVFTASEDEMLSERKAFAFPPFTRMVDICIHDANESRLALMSRLLQQRLSSLLGRWKGVNVEYRPGTVRVFLPKDRLLQERKTSIRNIISSFETERRYAGHITVDVDPL